MRLTRLLVPIVALAATLAACGSSGESSSGEPSGSAPETSTPTNRATQPPSTATTPAAPPGASARACASAIADITGLRVTGVGCNTGRVVAAGWSGDSGCASPAGASRFACTVRGYRCLGAATGRGIAVSCAQPNRSIAFTAKRR